MSRDMPWKPSTVSSSSRLSSVKSYISQRDFKNLPNSLQRGVSVDGTKQSWKAWAGQKISEGMRGAAGGSAQGTERIALFPGWAARRWRRDAQGKTLEAFDIDLFVSGFASSHRAPELASRSQRAFIRLAKGFAALPKLDGSSPEPELTKSTEDLMASVKLPPRPTEITEDFEVEALERQLQRINSDSSSESSSDDSADSDLDSPIVTSSTSSAIPSTVTSDVRRLHHNLETRIQPFWSSVISSRPVRLRLFASPLKGDDAPPRHNSTETQDALEHGPVVSRDVTTGIDGSFQARIRVTWEELCQHPGALHIAFGDPTVEHELLVTAALFPAPPSGSAAPRSAAPPPPIETKTLHITLTYSPMRVISDIDDTVKVANVISGARAIFYNVFVKEYKDIVIPGMGEWYTRIWRRGVRFHYVSNGPFELLPVLADFFKVAQLPPGSIKLRSYAGRSLFSGLLSAPAARKRAGVQEILEAFPESRFFLIGDSGEQDLELYAELARERPQQVLAVFIRDVESGEVISDPTGQRAMGAASLNGEAWPKQSWSVSPVSRAASSYSIPSPTRGEYFGAKPLSSEPEPIVDMTPRPASRSGTPGPARSGALRRSNSSASQRAFDKRHELQLRVWRARTQMPGLVPLRVFRAPAECVEAEEILGRERV
ncbi:hypothetical protein DFH07DRAFT_913580 [Mycena maculata]|uniref:Phosphatidate phosphatase APP1 catalytic domain-containing protein n=1 Tax=Mycena maculata TaxID=230809 RepID=A0AAD7JVT3_9AGAR|nr:hypothetical protein DFH07DRAFT_913580 [Mycena maculata]